MGDLSIPSFVTLQNTCDTINTNVTNLQTTVTNIQSDIRSVDNNINVISTNISSLTTSEGTYLPLTGGTLTGTLVVPTLSFPASAVSAQSSAITYSATALNGIIQINGDTNPGAINIASSDGSTGGQLTGINNVTMLSGARVDSGGAAGTDLGRLTGTKWSYASNVMTSADDELVNKGYVDSTISTSLNSYMPEAGGTMTGALVLNSDPATALGAATKQYVDAADTALNSTVTTIQSTLATNQSNIADLQTECKTWQTADIKVVHTASQSFTPVSGLTCAVTWSRFGAAVSIYVNISFTSAVTTTPLQLFTWANLNAPGYNSAGTYLHPLLTTSFVVPLVLNNSSGSAYSTGNALKITGTDVSLINGTGSDTTATLSYHWMFNDTSSLGE